MALRTVPRSPNSVTIAPSSLAQIHINKEVLDTPTYWHKFIVADVHGLKRNTVLKILIDYLKPVEFIPLCYTQCIPGAYFFARICRQAIEKFCNDKLTLPNPFDITKPFQLKIILRYSTTEVVKVDLSENVLMVLQKRLKSQILCLNNFTEDTDLTEFILLSQSKLLAFVLNVAKKLKLKGIKLCNNDIKTLEAFRVMQTKSIVSMDLRHNLLTDLAELKYLEDFNITELWLEGNPLCDLYDEYNYVQQVIKYCPKVEKLDGFLLRQNGVPSFRRNFLCNMSAYSMIDHFLELYFPAYDAKNLSKLETLYHENVLFSMTAEFYQKQLSSPESQLKSYKVYSRNLLNTPSNKNLYTGGPEILKLFNVLPHSEHDPYSFTVDVLYYTPKCAIVVVTGVFREVANIKRLLGFNRCFVLECRNDDNYRIANEQMHVFNALTSQQVTAFKKPSVLQEARTPTERNQMVNTFTIITNLTKDYAKLFLEECDYNLKHAVLYFVDLYRSDKIPAIGFKNSLE